MTLHIHAMHLSNPLSDAGDLLLTLYVEGQVALRDYERQIVVIANGVRLFARSDDAGLAKLALTGIVGIVAKLGSELRQCEALLRKACHASLPAHCVPGAAPFRTSLPLKPYH